MIWSATLTLSRNLICSIYDMRRYKYILLAIGVLASPVFILAQSLLKGLTIPDDFPVPETNITDILWTDNVIEPIPLPGEEGSPDSYAELIERLAKEAEKYLGTKYRYGATGPRAFDCSAFIGHLYRNIGIDLHRTSRMQYTQGEAVDYSDLRPGDLMFFSSPRSGKGRVGHVAMVVTVDPESDSLTFVHVSSSKGITYQNFPDDGYFNRTYIGSRRII